MSTPAPGSQAAYQQGCTCPLQRAREHAGLYWYRFNRSCLLHGRGDWQDPDREDKLLNNREE